MNLQDKIQTLQDRFNVSCGKGPSIELPHGSSFEGIPQNLDINFSSWVLSDEVRVFIELW